MFNIIIALFIIKFILVSIYLTTQIKNTKKFEELIQKTFRQKESNQLKNLLTKSIEILSQACPKKQKNSMYNKIEITPITEDKAVSNSLSEIIDEEQSAKKSKRTRRSKLGNSGTVEQSGPGPA